jgi:hypothetical protein
MAILCDVEASGQTDASDSLSAVIRIAGSDREPVHNQIRRHGLKDTFYDSS